jgi:hypothetical protein
VRELFLPRTDAGVAAQVAVVLVVAIGVGMAVRRERSLVLLTSGLALVLLGLMGMRALH